MSKIFSTAEIVRAWKDAEYRATLSEEERASLPEHPAGWVELSDAQMETVMGAQQALTTPNCIVGIPAGTATGMQQCGIMQYTFAAPDPRNGCQISVNNWTCTNLPKI
jgi:mersacidin/lichenicidin family type 2 lantibiotic